MEIEKGSLKVVKVLVIDDNPAMVKLLAIRLLTQKYEVVTASNGIEGLNAAREHLPNLIILDVNMPELDGCGFVDEIKEIDVLKKIPIIVYTAKDDLQNFLLEKGVNAYLKKPLDPTVFLEKIKTFV